MREAIVARTGWHVALAAIALLPALTWTEAWTPIRGAELHGRFILWASAAVLLTVTGAMALRKERVRDPILIIGLAWLGWLAVTSLLGGEGPREWGPTVLRWVLYLSALATAMWWARRARDGRQLLAPYFATVAVGAAIPLAVGFVQFASGNAPTLNNAPRMTGTMLGHPVALSLVLGSALLLTFPLLMQPGRKRWVAVGFMVALYIGVMLTFTRATMLLIPPAAVVVVALTRRSWRDWRPIAATSLVAAVALAVSVPFVGARIGSERPMPVQVPGATPGEVAEGPVPIDNSTGLRLETHLYGVQYIGESPVVGHGPGSFDRLFAEDTGDTRVAAHNDLLQTAVETGVVGILLVLALFAAVFRALFREVRHADGPLRWTAAAVGVSFAVVNLAGTIHNPLYFPEVQLPIWAGVGMLIGLTGRASAS